MAEMKANGEKIALLAVIVVGIEIVSELRGEKAEPSECGFSET